MTAPHRSIATLVLFVGLLGVALGGCVDHDDEQRTGWIDRSAPGELQAEPGIFEFGPSEIGTEVVERVEVTNIGARPVEITSIELHEDYASGPETDGHREFFEGEGGWVDEAVSLAPGESYVLPLRYVRRNAGADRGRVVFHTKNTIADTFEIPVDASAVAPDIDAPRRVDFGRVPVVEDSPGESELITVQNVGQAVLHLDDIFVMGSERFRVTFPQPQTGLEPADETDDWPEYLAPGEDVRIRVWFRPADNLPERAELVFETNDPEESLAVVVLSGNEDVGPCLDVHPDDELDFGEVAVGVVERRAVTLENCSREHLLEISGVALADDAGGVFRLEADQLLGDVVLEPGERRQVEVVVQPSDAQTCRGELVVSSNADAREEFSIPISARGRSCPVEAVATARVEGSSREFTTIETRPLNMIEFDGAQSSSPNGQLIEYEWTILARPQGSTSRMLPDNHSVTPRLFIDLIGTYQIGLEVTDQTGARSCRRQAVVTIVATPDDDVYIQLVWNTPEDPDPSDTLGTDLDLHYLHPNGQWDEAPWDIFWRNPNEDWGIQGDRSDDPRLDIDDTDGAGPENIAHRGLENETYRVGTYYYSDNTLGASYATLRVYTHGMLALEMANHHMPRTGSFWEAALIHGNSLTVNPIDRLHEGFPGQ